MEDKLLVLIPAYNEAENIETVVENLTKNFPQYDYLVVNDGSKDDTLAICKRRGFHYMDLPINLGLECGFRAGMKYAYRRGYDYLVQFDADGQHLPEYIAPMYEKIKEGYDIVIGSRFVTEKKPWSSRMMGSRLIAGAIFLTTGQRIKDPTSGMRMYNRKCMAEFEKSYNLAPEPDTVSYLIKCGAKVAEVQANMQERLAGKSYLTFTRSISYMARMILSILVIQTFRKR